MKRPRSHVIEDESEMIFRSYFPIEWIIRKLPKDYGVDYEVEIVENEIVTGIRLWFQLKGTNSLKVRKKRIILKKNLRKDLRKDLRDKKFVYVKYIAYKADTKLLKYSLNCDFPLLLGLVDVSKKEVYWLPLRDEIELNLELNKPDWREQKSVTISIPIGNIISDDRKRDYFGLRWYAMEPARMRAFSILHYYHDVLKYESRLSGYEIGEGFIEYGDEEELAKSLTAAKSYLKLALEIDCLFGRRGLDVHLSFIKPQMLAGLNACNQLLQNISQRRISFESTGKLLAVISIAVELMSTSISMYQDYRKRFLFTEEGALWSVYFSNIQN